MTKVKRRLQRGSKDFYLVELLYTSDNFNKKIKRKQREVGKKDGEKRGASKESAKEPLMIYRGFSFITANSPSPQTPNSSWFQRGSREREERGKIVPRPRLLIFYASHSMTLVREGRRFGTESRRTQRLATRQRGADFQAHRKPPRIPRAPFSPGCRCTLTLAIRQSRTK